MKNYLIILLISFSGILVAQEGSAEYSAKPEKKVQLSVKQHKASDENDLATVNRAYTMAVYPGCEDFVENKRESINCFSEKLKNESMRFITMEYPEEMAHKKFLAAQVEFIIDKEGKITKIQAKRGDKIFKPEAEKAVNSAARWLIENDTFLTPAKLKDGKAVDLIFTVILIFENPNFSEE